ncbi:uncharacterized protein LOC144627453 [Crassostrea virginica]
MDTQTTDYGQSEKLYHHELYARSQDNTSDKSSYDCNGGCFNIYKCFFSVNASSSIKRDLKGIKKKWVDIQSHTRKKEAARRREQTKTGGGPPPDFLKAWEDKIVDVLDDDMITGLEGGFDSMMAPSEVEMRVTEANYPSVANTTCISQPECTMSLSRGIV